MPDHPNDRSPPSLGTVRPGDSYGQDRARQPRNAPAGRPEPRLANNPQAGRAPPSTSGAGDFRGPRTIYKRAEAAEHRRSRGLGSFIVYSLVGLVALVVVGITFLLLAPPTDLIRDRLVAEVKARTGRDLVVAGEARFTFVPSLGIKMKDVSLSAPAGMPGPPLLKAARLEVSVALMPLITREVQIDQLVLVKPVIDLRVDANGRRSWDFAEAEGLRQAVPARYAQASPPRGQEFRKLPADLQDFAKNASPAPKPGDKLAGVNAVSLGDVRIVDGLVRYADARTGQQHEAQGIDARVTLKELGGPLDVVGSLVYAKERITIDGRIGSLRDMLEERPSRITLKLAAAPLAVSYDGQVAPGTTGLLDGRVSVKSPSAAGLARFLQVPIAGLDAIGAIDIEGQLKTAAAGFAMSNATFGLGDLAATGALAVDVGTGRPQIKTTLKIATLDLNRLGQQGAAVHTGPPAAAPTVKTPSAPAPSGPAQSIDDLLKRTDAPASPRGPAVRGFTKRSGEVWSVDAIDLGALRYVDLDGRFEIGRLLWQDIKVGQTQLQVVLKSGVLKANIADAELYGGHVKGLINLDAREAESVIGVNLSADGVAAAALLKDAAGLDMVEGRGRVVIAVSAKGVSERDLVGTLAGKAELRLGEGAVVGWNVTELMGQMAQLKLPSFDRKPNARTPFTELAGTFQIANGVARNQDLRFESAVLRATGSGVINLVDRNLDMTVKPKPAAASGLGQIDVPLRIAGNFEAITVVPDMKGSETVKQLGRQVREGDIDGAVRGILGGGPGAEEKAAKAKELLRQFLRP